MIFLHLTIVRHIRTDISTEKHWTLALGTLYFACASLYSYWLRKQEMHPQVTQQEHELSLEVEAQTQPLEAVGELTEDDESEVELQDDGVAPAERNNGADEADRRRAEAANALNHRLRNRLDQQDSYHRSHMRIKVSFGELCLWLGYETIWAASIFLSITFWVFVGLGCLPHKGCQNVPGNFWAGQILNILFIGSELALNKLPFIPTHSVWTLCYCFLWLIFSTMLFLLTGQWFYPTEDPHRGQLRAAFTFWPGWIVLNVVSFMLGLLIEWVVARIFPSKHTFMTPNRGSS